MRASLAPDVESFDDAVAERAEVGEAPAAVAVPRAARLAQRSQAHGAVREDVGVVELRQANLLQGTQPSHLRGKMIEDIFCIPDSFLDKKGVCAIMFSGIN